MISLNVVLPHLGRLAAEMILLAPRGTDEVELRTFDRGNALIARARLCLAGFACSPVTPDAPYAFRVTGRRADA